MDRINLPNHVVDKIERRWATKLEQSLGDGSRMIIDKNMARMRTHQSNIRRYDRLLQTNLSDVERQYVGKRLAEERAALQRLADATFPIAFNMPGTTPAGIVRGWVLAEIGHSTERNRPLTGIERGRFTRGPLPVCVSVRDEI
ncbi:hypothetical protein [Bradyrhizobium sp. USDA 3364]